MTPCNLADVSDAHTTSIFSLKRAALRLSQMSVNLQHATRRRTAPSPPSVHSSIICTQPHHLYTAAPSVRNGAPYQAATSLTRLLNGSHDTPGAVTLFTQCAQFNTGLRNLSAAICRTEEQTHSSSSSSSQALGNVVPRAMKIITLQAT